MQSKFSDHKFKKGILYTPFNNILGDRLSLSPWTTEWLPEYLWIGLILDYYGRDYGLKTLGRIMQDLYDFDTSLCIPILSKVLLLDPEKQNTFYNIVCHHIDSSILSPLTVMLEKDKYTLFHDFFMDLELNTKSKLDILQRVIKNNLFHQTHEATDIRFIVIWFYICSKKICFAKDMESTKALSEYHMISHDDPKMELYRPLIRSTEMGLRFIEDRDNDFAILFWNNFGILTSCQPVVLNYAGEDGKNMDILEDTTATIEYLMANNKTDLILSAKFNVIMGLTTYALKLYREIICNNNSTGILGRIALRTIIEVYMLLKYMTSKEEGHPDIWKSFQEYGVGKYKYVIIKARETESDLIDHHFALPVLEALVNKDKSEQFTNMDTRLFDNQNVRNKFQAIGESELYDLYYEYDTNFIHGLWGAITESAMLQCDNPAHMYHLIPDITFEQRLKNVEHDCQYILKKIFSVISCHYELPEFYLNKYGD